MKCPFPLKLIQSPLLGSISFLLLLILYLLGSISFHLLLILYFLFQTDQPLVNSDLFVHCIHIETITVLNKGGEWSVQPQVFMGVVRVRFYHCNHKIQNMIREIISCLEIYHCITLLPLITLLYSNNNHS